MTDADFKAYRDGRYTKMLKYYDDKAVLSKRLHRACSLYILFMSAAISPMVLMFKEHAQAIAAVLSPTITLVTAMAGQFHFNDNWLRYRGVWDALNHEIHFHDAKLDAYATSDDPHRLFVERVETLIAQEGREWLRCHALKEQTSPPTSLHQS